MYVCYAYICMYVEVCTCTSATGLQLKYMSYVLVYVPHCHVHKDNDKRAIYQDN